MCLELHFCILTGRLLYSRSEKRRDKAAYRLISPLLLYSCCLWLEKCSACEKHAIVFQRRGNMKTGKTHKEIPWSQIRVELSKDEAAAQGDAFLVLRSRTRLRIIH